MALYQWVNATAASGVLLFSYIKLTYAYAVPGLRANASHVMNLFGIVSTEKYSIITDGSQLNVVWKAWDAWIWCTFSPFKR